jgi:hypothetical protein
VLRANKVPAGTDELPTEVEKLRDILITREADARRKTP